MGKSGSQLDNLLSGGSAALNELSQAAERLGIVLSDDEIRHADETADKLRAVKTVLSAQIASTVAKNADAILSLASALGKLSGEIVKFLNSNPQLALGIIGALIGGRIGGLPGAAVGAIGGAALGQRMASSMANSNMDLKFRMEQVRKAKADLEFAKKSSAGGRVMPGVGVPLGGDTKAAEAELRKQTALLIQATAASKSMRTGSVAGGGGSDIGQFLASGGGGKAKQQKEDHTAEDQLREAYQFGQDVRRAQMDTLQAKRDLAHSAEEQAALDIQMLDLQKQDHDAELDYQVSLNKLTKGKEGMTEEQAKQLQIEYDKTDALKRQAVADNLAAEKSRDAAELRDSQYDLQIEQLQLEADLTTNSKDRRDAELRILDVMKRQEKARLEAVIADEKSTGLAKQQAQARLDALDQIYAGREQITINGTRNPLEELAASVPKTAAEITQAFQQIEVDGIEGLTQALTDVITGTESLKDAFHKLAASVLADLIQMTIKMLLFRAISSAIGAIGGGVGGGASAGAGGGSFPVLMTGSALPGFASGGSFNIMGRTGMDRNILSLNGLPVARVSHGERVNISNDNAMGVAPSVALTMHNDFRGADPSAVASIKAHLDQLEASLPSRVVSTMADARDRFLWRTK
jgi:lambda family phage tail tape measure protein